MGRKKLTGVAGTIQTSSPQYGDEGSETLALSAKNFDDVVQWVANTAAEASAVSSSFKAAVTPEGGFTVTMLNGTNAATVRGTVVAPCSGSAYTNTFDIAPSGSLKQVGVVYDAGVATSGSCRIVVAGIADVLVQASQIPAIGSALYVGSTQGTAMSTSGSLAATDLQKQVGFVLSGSATAVTAGFLARAVIAKR